MILADGAGTLAGPLGLLVVLLLVAASWVLFRSMTKRISRLPESFEKRDDDDS